MRPASVALSILATFVLHLTLANLKSGLDEAEAEGVVRAFGRLGSIPGVIHLGAVHASVDDATHSLGLFAYLRDLTALDSFGTDARHINFLRHSLVGAVGDLATTDVVTSVLPPDHYSAALCFGADVHPGTFDWQIRRLLDRPSGACVVSGGLAINERQRFRAAGVAFFLSGQARAGGRPFLAGSDIRGESADDKAAESALTGFKRRWDEVWGPIVTEAALVVGNASPLFVADCFQEKGN